jgi:2-keto-4-pentenoate hydratase/2-oxohepta-3-ene-1,7-dioic acid hydratase in catechol pathway
MKIVELLTVASLPFGMAACSEATPGKAVPPRAPALAAAVVKSDRALTFAQIRTANGRIATLLVTQLGKEKVRAIDVAELGIADGADPFGVIATLGTAALQKAAKIGTAARDYPIAQLLSPAGEGTRHIATGTNFREHAKEVELREVFNFPKFGRATAARAVVEAKPQALLDYEVEICARFDRDITSLAEFDAAKKGFFLCGDFTDRAQLMRLIDPQDIYSGQGFSDAKSGPGFFPTGPFLVVPSDWRSFVRAERVTTEVNDERRQDAAGGEMILDFRELVAKALNNGGGGRYTYQGSPVPLVRGGKIAKGSAIMSGTSAGVVFHPPQLRDYVSGGTAYIFTGPMMRGESAQRVLIDRFIAKERAAGRYLKVGDVVAHRSASMGELRVRVVPLGSTRRSQLKAS